MVELTTASFRSMATSLRNETPPAASRSRARELLMGLQDSICAGLEKLDQDGRFQEESWDRPEGGGGRSRVMKAGRIFEQGGVNFSEVQGEELPPAILNQRPEAKGHPWFALGTSMVLHPTAPGCPPCTSTTAISSPAPCGGLAGGPT